MNKKMYLPTVDELKQLEACKSINSAYEYVVAKVHEKVYAEVLFLDDMDELIKDNEDLIKSICYCEPIKISLFKSAQNDASLCKKVAFRNADESIKSLDNLSYFSESIQLDYDTIREAIHILSEKLPSNPYYRYVYWPSLTLDKIFLLDLPHFDKLTKPMLSELASIDPVYGIRFRKTYGPNAFDDLAMEESYYRYASRYGFDMYDGTRNRESVFKSENGKKLIKYLYK